MESILGDDIEPVIFLACLWAFRWCKRQVTYMRSLLFDPVWAMVQKSYGEPKRKSLTVFPQQEIGPFAVRDQVQLVDAGDTWELHQKRMLLPSKSHSLPKSDHSLTIEPGLIVNKIAVAGTDEPTTLMFTRRYNDHLGQLAEMLSLQLAAEESRSSVSDLVMEG